MNSSNIVAAARGWLGTRFHHQGRLKKTDKHAGGVDCLGLLVGVAAELNLLHQGRPINLLDQKDYSHYPDTRYLRNKLGEVLQEIPVAGMAPGDVLLLNIDHHPQHLAIVTGTHDGYGIIHAYAPARAVVEHALDPLWRARIVTAYRLP